jgi:hypothetical protein
MSTRSASEYIMFAPAQLPRNWLEQRPSNQGELDSSVTGEVGREYYTGLDLLLIPLLYRGTWWLLLSCVLIVHSVLWMWWQADCDREDTEVCLRCDAADFLELTFTNSCPKVFAAGVLWVTSTFRVGPRRMLVVAQRFSKHCSCHHTFTLKVATATFAETLDNYQHSTQPDPESRSYPHSQSFDYQSLVTGRHP